MHDFRAYILPKLPPPQRGLSAIAELLVVIMMMVCVRTERERERVIGTDKRERDFAN